MSGIEQLLATAIVGLVSGIVYLYKREEKNHDLCKRELKALDDKVEELHGRIEELEVGYCGVQHCARRDTSNIP
ncbi:MAG: hypothetical protein ACU843_12870 [Gammaproteobacteria bacterium]